METRTFSRQIKDAALAPLRGMRLLFTHGPLMRWVWVPLCLGTVAYLVVFGTGLKYVSYLLHRWLPQSEEWYAVALVYIAMVAVFLVLMTLGALLYTAFGRLLLSPFGELICVQTERFLGVSLARDLSWKEILHDLPRLFRVECLKALLILTLGAVQFAAVWIFPPAAFVTTLLGFWVLALQFVDYPMELRRLPLAHRLGWGVRHTPQLLLFGGVLTCLIGIPLAGILALPAGIVGGTMVFHQGGK